MCVITTIGMCNTHHWCVVTFIKSLYCSTVRTTWISCFTYLEIPPVLGDHTIHEGLLWYGLLNLYQMTLHLSWSRVWKDKVLKTLTWKRPGWIEWNWSQNLCKVTGSCGYLAGNVSPSMGWGYIIGSFLCYLLPGTEEKAPQQFVLEMINGSSFLRLLSLSAPQSCRRYLAYTTVT